MSNRPRIDSRRRAEASRRVVRQFRCHDCPAQVTAGWRGPRLHLIVVHQPTCPAVPPEHRAAGEHAFISPYPPNLAEVTP